MKTKCLPDRAFAARVFGALGLALAATGIPARAAVGGQDTSPAWLQSLSLRVGREPVAIEAGELEFQYGEGVLRYSGGVVLRQGALTLESRELTVTLEGPPPGEVREVVAQGAVRISKGERWARGDVAVFDQRRRTLELRGHAQLADGPNWIAGERVLVYLDEQRSVVHGGRERVQAVLYPGSLSEGLEGREDGGGTEP